LRAKDLINESTFSPRAKEDLFQAVELLTRAVARDPSFFNAYCELAAAHDKIYFLGFDHSKERLQTAERTIQFVREARPDSGETHLALAHHLYWAYRDYDQAKAELAMAKRSLPNESRIPLLTGYIDRRQGHWEKSVEEMKQALELDPHNFSILQQISLSYQALRRYEEALSTLDSALAIAPKDVNSRVRRAWVAAEWRADLEPLHTTIETVLADDPSAPPVIVYMWFDLVLRERDPAAAERVLAAMPAGGCYDENIPFPTSWCEGLGARLRGDDRAARDAFIRARNELEQTLRNERNYAQGLCALGVIDAALGNKEDAVREGELAVKLMPASASAIEGSVLIQYLAIIYAWTGDKDRAIQRLAEAAKLPGSHVTYGYLRLHLLWDPLRGDPRFEEIVASLAPKQ
jgi:tetratricopeptide (TPR) repeat protein